MTFTGFTDALRALTVALKEIDAPSMFIGGVAVIANGVPRATVDLDATIEARALDLGRLAAALGTHDVVPRIENAIEFAESRHVFLAQHQPSGIAVDLSLAWLPFEEQAIREAKVCDFAGVRICVARPEDLVIYKVVAARPRDIDDAEQLLLLHGRSMNLDRVREVVAEFAAALEDQERPALLARLLENTGFKAGR